MRCPDPGHQPDLQLVWDVPNEPGELKAVGYDRKGAIVAGATVRTAGAAATLELTVDHATIASGTRDVAHVTVRALDANGVFVPLAANELTFELSGPARLIGVDNGDPESHASYQGSTRGCATAWSWRSFNPRRSPAMCVSPPVPAACAKRRWKSPPRNRRSNRRRRLLLLGEHREADDFGGVEILDRHPLQVPGGDESDHFLRIGKPGE